MRTITGYVATVEDLLVSQQLVYREFFQSVPDPVFGDGAYPGAPFRMDGGPLQLSPAPRLGEHNDEILCQRLGYSLGDLGLTPEGEAP